MIPVVSGHKAAPDGHLCCCIDRVIELSKAFDEEDFDKFDRKRVPKVTPPVL